MKKLDNGLRSPKIKLRSAISRSLATLTMVASCQIGLADTSNTQPTVASIHGYSSASKINNQYIVILNDSQVNSMAVNMTRSNFSYADAKAAVVQQMSVDMATQARGTVVRQYSSAINGFVIQSRASKKVAALLSDVRVSHIEADQVVSIGATQNNACLLYTSPSPRDLSTSRMPSSA